MTADEDDRLTLDLAALAIQEQFLDEWRAGKRPRLSVYALRYPAYAAALAALVATLPPDAPLNAANATDQEEQEELRFDAAPPPLWNGAGVERALSSAFGAPDEQRDGEQLPRVAEQPSAYQTRPVDAAAPDTPSEPPSRE